jgi:isoquinoline 1-oxidoreductase beta subunit
MWAAVDPGLAIHPGNVVAQIEGALVMGTSIALHEAVPFKAGAATVSGLRDYPLLRMSEAPEFTVRLLETPEIGPQGVGESGVPPAAAAIANAMLASRGTVTASMPFAR